LRRPKLPIKGDSTPEEGEQEEEEEDTSISCLHNTMLQSLHACNFEIRVQIVNLYIALNVSNAAMILVSSAPPFERRMSAGES